MKLTAENFFETLKSEGVTFEIHDNCIFFSGDSELIKKLYALIESKPEIEAAVIRHINTQHGISLREFMTDAEGAGVKVELHELYNLTFTGGKDKSRARLAGILERNNRLKAAVILSIAAKNPDFLDVIQECACNRWSNGYSDSLLMAVLCNIAPTGETIKRDENGQILSLPKTNWQTEISSLLS